MQYTAAHCNTLSNESYVIRNRVGGCEWHAQAHTHTHTHTHTDTNKHTQKYAGTHTHTHTLSLIPHTTHNSFEMGSRETPSS